MQLVFKQKNLRAQFILTEGLYRLPGPSWIVFVKNVNILWSDFFGMFIAIILKNVFHSTKFFTAEAPSHLILWVQRDIYSSCNQGFDML